METIKQLLELFPYAIMGSVLAGIICGFIGVFVVSQRVVFLGASLTQAAIAGVAFSFLHLLDIEGTISSLFNITINDNSIFHHLEHTLFSLMFASFAVLIFSFSQHQKRITQDAVLGIIFVVSIAARVMLIQKSPVAEVSEIESILKGDILFIGEGEFFTLLILFVIILTIFSVFQKQLKFVVFDPDSASAQGINSKLWLLMFYLVVGMGIALTTRFVGDVFTFAYLIIPPSIAIIFGKKVLSVFIISTIIGAVVPPISIYLAFIFDFSSGPTAVIFVFLLFLFALGIRKLQNI